MRNPPYWKFCVETLAAALAAERGGADRIEVCENYQSGSDPSAELMRGGARAQIQFDLRDDQTAPGDLSTPRGVRGDGARTWRCEELRHGRRGIWSAERRPTRDIERNGRNC